MNFNSETNKVIVKYALLLTILYAVQLSVSYLMMLYPKPTDNVEILLKSAIPLFVVIIGNLLAMYFVMKDKKKFQIQNRYLAISTLCFRPVGVCILLIQIVLESKRASVEVNKYEAQ
jgi:hypothetical protein